MFSVAATAAPGRPTRGSPCVAVACGAVMATSTCTRRPSWSKSCKSGRRSSGKAASCCSVTTTWPRVSPMSFA
eukprot:8935307-Alexandrium_andersonii.AAC.1